MNRGGLCESCIAPGTCCMEITLGAGTFASECETMEEAEAFIRASDATVFGPPMPFHPAFKGEDGFWRWWCPKLSGDGRCLDYENRPYCCSHYPPGADPLCVHYHERVTHEEK